MSLSIAETEQVLQTVHDSLLALIYDDVSGIPGIRETLAKHGLKLNIQIEARVDGSTFSGEEELMNLGLPSSSSNAHEGLQEWRDMGIRMDDLREVADIEAGRTEQAERTLVDRVRTVAASLSSRGRNYSWGWLNLHYPEIGLGENPATVRDERFVLLSHTEYWNGIVEAALSAIKSRTDKFEVLSRLLTTLKFAKEHT